MPRYRHLPSDAEARRQVRSAFLADFLEGNQSAKEIGKCPCSTLYGLSAASPSAARFASMRIRCAAPASVSVTLA